MSLKVPFNYYKKARKHKTFKEYAKYYMDSISMSVPNSVFWKYVRGGYLKEGYPNYRVSYSKVENIGRFIVRGVAGLIGVEK